MRFFHKDQAPVIAWLTSQHAAILLLEWEREPVAGGFAFLSMTQKTRAAHPARPVTAADVDAFARRKSDPREAAKALKFYFHANSTAPEGRPLSLVEAVEHVEARAADNECLLAGGLEGGLVSVSRVPLSFQDGLKPVTWWGP
jgi:hypothetical protein